MKGLLRIIVALVFIASGFVKAIDLKGFSFKLEEYFSPSVFNFPVFEKYALYFAAVVVLLELVLGLMLLLKIKLKQTLFALIVLCVFFGFLTFYSAFYNVVTDCGCFGDAVKFTPWQSFWKDIILLILLIVLAIIYKRKTNDKSNVLKPIMALSVFVVLMVMIMAHGILHEPLIDFRAYKIGTDLVAEKEKIAKNPSEYKTFYTIKNQKTKEVKKVDQDEYINKNYWKDANWKIEEGKTTSEVVKKGYESEVSKFKIEDELGNDLTAEILNEPKVTIIFTYKPDLADANLVKQTETKAISQNSKTIGVSTRSHFYNQIPSYMMDEVAIKTIARSNPFVMVLQKGKIIEKLGAKDYLEKQ